MPVYITTELLDRYTTGQCTADEIKAVNEWLDGYEHDDDLISSLDEETQQIIKKRILEKILAKIDNGSHDQLHALANRYDGLKSKNQNKLIPLYAIAACILAIIAFGLFYRYRTIEPVNQTLPVAGAAMTAKLIHVENHTASLNKLTLPDSSVVWLNPQASIDYPKTFATAYRLVKMNGECFFEVTKAPSRPFIIQSPHVITKVWGTSFRVRDMAGQKISDVSVVTGKVSVRANRGNVVETEKMLPGEVILLPHQQALLANGKTEVNRRTRFTDPELVKWNKMSLNFDGARMAAIIPLLEKQFDVKITVADPSINDEVLNADLENFNLPDILMVFEKSSNIRFAINKNTILLHR